MKRYFVISIFDNMRIKVENVVSYLLLKFFGYFSVFETKKECWSISDGIESTDQLKSSQNTSISE